MRISKVANALLHKAVLLMSCRIILLWTVPLVQWMLLGPTICDALVVHSVDTVMKAACQGCEMRSGGDEKGPQRGPR